MELEPSHRAPFEKVAQHDVFTGHVFDERGGF